MRHGTAAAAAAALIVCAATGARANTSHHSGGGSGGGGSSECIRWEPIPGDMAARDMSSADLGGGALDGGALDGGSSDGDAGAPDMAYASLDPHAGMRCAEYASLFGCAFAGDPRPGEAWGGVALLTVAALALRG